MELDLQLHHLANSLKKGDIGIADIGELLPVSVMLHDLENLQPVCCSYMNNWGCERLGTSVEEVNELGEAYYERYFIKEESNAILKGMSGYLLEGDFSKQHNFFQQVKLHKEIDYTWFYTMSRIIKLQTQQELLHKLMLISCPIAGIDNLVKRFGRVLDQDNYIRQHYPNFAKLTKREKKLSAY